MTDLSFPYRKDVVKFLALCEAQNWRCCYCGIRCDGPLDAHDSPTIEHVVPTAAGGRRVWANEVMACKLCNGGRSSMRTDKYMQLVKWKGREKAARYGHRLTHRLSVRIWRAKRRRFLEAAQDNGVRYGATASHPL